jgi:hypothetical protein
MRPDLCAYAGDITQYGYRIRPTPAYLLGDKLDIELSHAKGTARPDQTG